MTKIITFGVFDLFHLGHLNLFLSIKKQFPDACLCVAIQKTESICTYKPNAKIWYSWTERAKIIQQLKCVDEVTEYSDVFETIQGIEFDVLVVGPDQNHASFQKAFEYCKLHKKRVVVIGRTAGISSSAIKQAVKK